MSEKMIYSKRFPKPEIDVSTFKNAPPIDEETRDRLNRMFQRLLYEDCYVPNPQRIAWSKKFVALAIKLSSEFEIDMDIYENSHCVSVDLYLTCTAFMGDMKDMFAELVKMCDDVSLFLPKDDPHDVLVSLTLYTHDRRRKQ